MVRTTVTSIGRGQFRRLSKQSRAVTKDFVLTAPFSIKVTAASWTYHRSWRHLGSSGTVRALSTSSNWLSSWDRRHRRWEKNLSS